MTFSYIDAIGTGFPDVQCYTTGTTYEDLIWSAGAPIPAKTTLDAWIAANSTVAKIAITKYEFRKLFTLLERVAIDNVQINPAVPANFKAMLLTMAKDMELSAEVILSNPDVAAGVGLLEQLGLIGIGRAQAILSNTAPQ